MAEHEGRSPAGREPAHGGLLSTGSDVLSREGSAQHLLPDGAIDDPAPAGDVLRLTRADKRYPGVHALREVSLAVQRGEVHAIVGENGAGKSTLVGVAAGTVAADGGMVEINGARAESPTPEWSRRQGLAIVHQEPALLPDLTVAENMRLGTPEHLRPSAAEQVAWASRLLEPWRGAAEIGPGAYVRNLRPGERFVVEIARAMGGRPSVLILDEPTEHLLPDGIEALFEGIRREIERGGAVVYISHRIPEVMRIADRVSVLRDGACRGTFEKSAVSEAEIVRLIVGRRLDAKFPDKPDPTSFGEVLLEVESLTGPGFERISMSLREGEIVGLGGIDGGQRQAMRALAGLSPSKGNVRVRGRRVRLGRPAHARAGGLAYLPADRHSEGLLPKLGVRENLTVRALPQLSSAGVVRGSEERRAALEAVEASHIKARSLDTDVGQLSGGNQQKVLLAQVMLSNAPVILADEPTQGVDVGARTEIYRILREATGNNSCALVVSSDAAELQGLCDRVLAFSRGRIVEELDGDDVTEERVTEVAMTATTERRRPADARGPRGRPLKLAEHDIAPSAVLIMAILALGALATAHDSTYLTTQNFGLMLPMFAALACIALGQQMVIMLGGIDLSVGPLAGLVIVIGSFALSPEQTALGLGMGWLLVLSVAVAVGLLNWSLIAVVRISPLIATLVTFMGIQGVSLLIRDVPGGAFAPDILNVVQYRLDFVPVVAIAAVIAAIALELALYRSILGLRFRSVGSRAEIARKVGIRGRRVELLAYVGCSLLALAGAILLMPQVGTGDPTAGTAYTLLSVSAVVLGGASLFGGRGSFVGAVLGAGLIVQITTVVQFLELTDYWEQYLLGGLTIAAVALYSKARAAMEG